MKHRNKSSKNKVFTKFKLEFYPFINYIILKYENITNNLSTICTDFEGKPPVK